jgi:hypothetical protein
VPRPEQAAPLSRKAPWLGPHLCEAAAAFLGARYHRLRSRRGSLEANKAVMVRSALAASLAASGRASAFADLYLEKIVQLPLTLPALTRPRAQCHFLSAAREK